MEVIKYPDGSSYVKNIRLGKIIHRINSYEDLWHLNQAVDCYVNSYNVKPKVFIPNLIDAQADRRFSKNESSGLKLVCKFLNSMDVERFEIYHPHNPEVVEALIDNVDIISNTHFIKDVLSEIYCNTHGIKRDMGLYYHSKLDNLILMSSDAGGYKPLMKLCDRIKWKGETYSASKSRKYENGESKITQLIDREDFGGKDVLIVDDICVYGGTFKGLATLLRERNVGKIYLAVSHMTIENHKGKDTVFDYYDGVFTTNSKFSNYWIENRKGEPTRPKNLTTYNII